MRILKMHEPTTSVQAGMLGCEAAWGGKNETRHTLRVTK